jgi:hypothetical protein
MTHCWCVQSVFVGTETMAHGTLGTTIERMNDYRAYCTVTLAGHNALDFTDRHHHSLI